MKAYHFTSDKLRDGRPVPAVGEVLTHEGLLGLCVSGLHASKLPSDALEYAPGCLLHLVEVGGQIIEGNDKLVAETRTILKTIDATELMQEYARWCALQVVHLWPAPDFVVQWLKTGEGDLEEVRRAARTAAARAADAADAARAAAWATAWAARAAAWADAATWAADAARAAAARAADAAYAADAADAADAAWAARAAAWATAWAARAAWAAMRQKLAGEFDRRVEEAFK